MLAVAVPARRPGRAGLVALACLTGWAAWSALSVTWAVDPAWAWQAAGRAWLVTGIAALVLLWPGTASDGVRAWMAAIVVAGIALAQATGAWVGAIDGTPLADGRLRGGIPYANGFAMLMAAGALAALGCAASGLAARRTRTSGALWTAAAVALLATGLAAQSRSSLPALAVGVLVLGALAAPLRAAVVATACALGGAAFAVPAVVDVRTAALAGDAAGHAARAVLWIAGGAALAGALAWWAARTVCTGDQGLDMDAHAPGGSRRGVLLALAACAALVPIATSVVASRGDYTRIESSSTRFSAGAGSNRPDMWRVALDRVGDRPLLGVGAGSFKRPYLQARRTGVSPRFAHAVWAEAAATLGLPGLLLVAGALGGLLAGALASRRRTLAAAGIAAAGAAVLAQALVDWSTELPVLGALLVLALAAAHPARAPVAAAGPRAGRRAPAAVLAVALLVATAAVAPLALAGHLVARAGDPDTAPAAALRDLDRAARLAPLDPRPLETRAFVAWRAGDLTTARADAARARRRAPDDWLALWLTGVLDLAAGRRAQARAALAQAAALDPGERAIRLARSAADRGEPVDPADGAGWVFGG